MKIARVALDVPLAQTFDYCADNSEARVGDRVLVPFGKRRLIGVVLEIASSSDVASNRIRNIGQVLHGGALSDDDLRLLRFATDYYHYPIGAVVMSALPQRLKRIAPPLRQRMQYAITEAGLHARMEDLPKRARVRRSLLATLQTQRSLTPKEARSAGASASAAIRDFLERGWIARVEAPPPLEKRLVPAARAEIGMPEPTLAQASAISAITQQLDRFHPVLLCGVTGSGKTEVYLRVAEAVLARGGQVLMLVPEIALTPQLEAMVQTRFPATPIVSLHSGLNESERAAGWLDAHCGRARIVLGTRLAVFTPLPKLGLIIVDEEHDTSLKQSEGFCYSARDLAVVRASQLNVPVVLGSATPSLESYQNAANGRYALLELPERVNARPPRIDCIALDPRSRNGISPRLIDTVRARLARREQSLIFINRRGYAPVLTCRSCGWISGCHRCSAQLVLHLPARELHCHHCGYEAAVPEACPTCGNPALTPLGQGTQRIEETLAREFPAARIVRIDRDSTRGKHAWGKMRERIRARDVDILVGTQMLAKGHDFPHLALVGVLNADSMLYSADFRASERLYALLTQVAGRAGRGEAQGEVLIQTQFPDHPLYLALRAQDVHQFAHQLLAQRGSSGFPPFVHQALLRAEAGELEIAVEFLHQARHDAVELAADVELFDVVPATMVRLAGRERAQLLVQSHSRAALHKFLSAWCDRLAARKTTAARWTLEVDPAEL